MQHLVCISDDVTYDVIVYVKIKQWTLRFNRNNR